MMSSALTRSDRSPLAVPVYMADQIGRHSTPANPIAVWYSCVVMITKFEH